MLPETRFKPLVVLALALSLAGCSHGPQHTEDAGPAVEVAVIDPAQGAAGSLVLPARIKAAQEATLRARTGARVSAFVVREGTVVREGAVLVRFDAPEAKRALEAARSDEQAARVAAAFASRQYTRIESLFTAGVVATADREDAESRSRTAAARLAQATAAREAAESAFEVRAPFTGVLVRRHVDVGADVAAGTPLVDLRSTGGIEIVTSVPEAAAAALASTRAWVQVGEGPWQSARLIAADGMVDPVTRTRGARFALRDGGSPEPGAYARIKLERTGAAASKSTLSVPRTSLVQRGALTGVYVVDGERVWLRWLTPGRGDAETVDVLSGLDAGMRVVADPRGLRDGARVITRTTGAVQEPR